MWPCVCARVRVDGGGLKINSISAFHILARRHNFHHLYFVVRNDARTYLRMVPAHTMRTCIYVTCVIHTLCKCIIYYFIFVWAPVNEKATAEKSVHARPCIWCTYRVDDEKKNGNKSNIFGWKALCVCAYCSACSMAAPSNDNNNGDGARIRRIWNEKYSSWIACIKSINK